MASVFILDNDRDIREMLCAVYAMSGVHECITTASVDAMVNDPDSVLHTDLAVLDMNLGPGQPSGSDACRWLREHRYRGKIAFLTGHGRAHPLVLEAERQGARIFEKPVDIEVLTQLIRSVQ